MGPSVALEHLTQLFLFYGDNCEFRSCVGEQWEIAKAYVPSQNFSGRGLHITKELMLLESQCDSGGHRLPHTSHVKLSRLLKFSKP